MKLLYSTCPALSWTGSSRSTRRWFSSWCSPLRAGRPTPTQPAGTLGPPKWQGHPAVYRACWMRTCQVSVILLVLVHSQFISNKRKGARCFSGKIHVLHTVDPICVQNWNTNVWVLALDPLEILLDGPGGHYWNPGYKVLVPQGQQKKHTSTKYFCVISIVKLKMLLFTF